MVKPFPQKALCNLTNLQGKALSGSRGRRRPAFFKNALSLALKSEWSGDSRDIMSDILHISQSAFLKWLDVESNGFGQRACDESMRRLDINQSFKDRILSRRDPMIIAQEENLIKGLKLK